MHEQLCSDFIKGVKCTGYTGSELCSHCSNLIRKPYMPKKLSKEEQRIIEDNRAAVRLKKNEKRIKKGKKHDQS